MRLEPQAAKGLATRLARLSTALAKLDTLSHEERLQLLDAWEFLGARYSMIRALLLASVTQRRRPSGSVSSQDDDALLTVPEVATHLRVSRSQAYKLLRSKVLPSVKIGERQVRVSRSALQAYLEQSRKGVT
jgi:excisionase family DNA binding protein